MAGAIIAVLLFVPAPSSAAIRVHHLLHGEALATPQDPPTSFKIFDHGGLKLKATCFDIAGLESEVTAYTERDHATIHANHQLPDGHAYAEDDDWNIGDPAIPVGSLGPSSERDQLGQIVYVVGKSVVTVDLLASAHYDTFPGDKDCLVAGTARVLTGGGQWINARMESGAESTKVFDRGGLRLFAGCTDNNLVVLAGSSSPSAALQLNAQSGLNESLDPGHITQQTESFGAGQVSITSYPNFEDSAVGQLIYARGKTVVSVDWLAEEDVNSVAGAKDCAFAGIARVAGPDSKSRVLFRTEAPGPAAPRAGGGTDTESFPVYGRGGMELRGTCEWPSDSPTPATLHIYPSSTVDDAALHANSQSDMNEDEVWELGYRLDNDFDDFGDAPLMSGFGEDDEISGQLVFAHPTGRVLSLDFLGDTDELFGRRCTFAGTTELGK